MTQYCAGCGTVIPPGRQFCARCGRPAAQAVGQAVPQPRYQAVYAPDNTAPLTTGQFLGMLCLCAIPVVGFIMLLVWAFGDGNMNKKSFARAYLLFGLIIGAVSTIISLLFMVPLLAALGSLSQYYY